MQYILMAILFVGLGLWIASQSPAKRRNYISILLMVVLAIAVVFLVASGRAGIIIAFFAALLPFARRLLPLLKLLPFLKLFKRQKKPSDTGSSEVVTNELKMSLNHGDGKIDGEILIGRFSGKQLSQLSFDEIVNMYEFCSQEQSDTKALLKNYLEKMWANQWQNYLDERSKDARPNVEDGAMSLVEAYRLLDIGKDASRDDIIQAHRKLMSRVHPDKGGSAYLAARLNEAKERLMGEVDS